MSATGDQGNDANPAKYVSEMTHAAQCLARAETAATSDRERRWARMLRKYARRMVDVAVARRDPGDSLNESSRV